MPVRFCFLRGRAKRFQKRADVAALTVRVYVNDTRWLDRRHSGAARSSMSYNLSYNLRLQCGCVLYVF
jgi:hypothetical protein